MITYSLEEGTKPLKQPLRVYSRAFSKVAIVPAWRVVGSDGKATVWTSVREEACAWGRMLRDGYRPAGAQYQ